MSPVDFKLDISKFQEAISYVFRNTDKELPEILNHQALVTIIGGRGVQGAMQRTPKADVQKIKSVPVREIAKVVMARARLKGEKLKRKEIAKRIGKEYKRRIAARGYTAFVGWNKAAVALGGRGVGHRAAGIGYAQMGYAIPANYATLTTIMVNTAPAAEAIGFEPLQDALNDTAIDMVQHIDEKLGYIMREVSV